MYEIDYEEEIVKYLPFVKRVVNRIDIKSTDYDKDDLFNIGVIGLMDALKKY
ncbi:MAG: FliA/WhiG family RNA polymerase sigma factor, partial [Vagococcus sp.]